MWRRSVNVREFQENRARFSWDDLRKYDGQWVAFSSDGRRVVASHDDLMKLNDLIIAAGEDPQDTPLERIEFDNDSWVWLKRQTQSPGMSRRRIIR